MQVRKVREKVELPDDVPITLVGAPLCFRPVTAR